MREQMCSTYTVPEPEIIGQQAVEPHIEVDDLLTLAALESEHKRN